MLGVRYEFATPQYEKDNFLTNFDPTTNTLIAAKDGSVYDRALVNPDRNNFAPRFGVAWAVDDKTVIRGGYGISYIHFNRMGGENLLSFNGPHVVGLNINQTINQPLCVGNANPTSCFRTTQAGYPEGYTTPASFNPLNVRVNYIPKDTPTGNVRSWHASVQREVLSNLLIDVAYVGNKSRDILILGDFNQARPNAAGENASLQARRPIQGFQEIQAAFAGGKGDYHALQMKVERRYSRGLYLLNSFTYSRARDNASGHLEVQNGDNSRVNYRNLDGEFGRSGYDQPLNNTTSVVWELPFGKGRKWAADMSPVMEGVLGGWRLVGINIADERRADQPVVLADRELQRQRQPDVSPEPDGRSAHAQRRRLQLPQSRDGRRPDRSDAALRQRAEERGPRHAVQLAGPRAPQVVRPGRRPAPRGAHRGVQRVQPHELPDRERQPVGGRLRHDHVGVPGAAAAARREVLLLTLSGGLRPRTPLHALSRQPPPALVSYGCRSFAWLGRCAHSR